MTIVFNCLCTYKISKVLILNRQWVNIILIANFTTTVNYWLRIHNTFLSLVFQCYHHSPRQTQWNQENYWIKCSLPFALQRHSLSSHHTISYHLPIYCSGAQKSCLEQVLLTRRKCPCCHIEMNNFLKLAVIFTADSFRVQSGRNAATTYQRSFFGV